MSPEKANELINDINSLSVSGVKNVLIVSKLIKELSNYARNNNGRAIQETESGKGKGLAKSDS